MPPNRRFGFTLIELLVVIAIIAILAVVVVLTLNPAELLRQSRDANRVSDMATLTSALNLYTTDQGGASSFNLGNASNTYVSIADPAATSTNACGSLGLPVFTSGSWQCSASSSYRTIASSGWIPVNLNAISAGTPIGSLPVDPTNQTSSGLYYVYNTNGTQFEVTADLESSKYKSTYASNPQTSYFPEIISGGAQNISALYNNSGLVGYWPLDEGSGTVAYDHSGNGNNGSLEGSAQFSPGKVGQSGVYVPGSYNAVPIPASPLFALSTFTIAYWQNLSVGNIQMADQWNAGGCGGSNEGWAVENTHYFWMCNASGDTIFSFTQILNAWHFYVFTFDGSKAIAYVDGIMNASSSESAALYSGSPNFVIGAEGNTANGSTGYYDDVRLYNRALSPAEIMALYNAEK